MSPIYFEHTELMQHMVVRKVTYNDIGDLEPLHIRSELKTAEPDWKRLVRGCGILQKV